MAADPAGRATRIERGHAPEADATRDLYERYSGQIFGYCVQRLGSREEAEDAVQSTFLNAFRALGRGVVPESESAWLFKIAENVCHSRHRSSWRRGRVESPSDLDAFQDVLPAPVRVHEDLIPLSEALERLPQNQRRAILLREWQGLSYREIAEELQLSQSAVETLIFRARRSLVEGLEAPSPPRGNALQRAAHGIDIGWIVGLLKTLFAGGAAVKAAAVAVAVTGVTVGGHRHHAVHVAAPAARPQAKAHVKRQVDRPVVHATAAVRAPVVHAPVPKRTKARPAPRRPVVVVRRVPSRGPVVPDSSPAPAPKPPRGLTAEPPPPASPPPPILEQESPKVVPDAKPTSPSPPPSHDTTTQSSDPPPELQASTQTITVAGG